MQRENNFGILRLLGAIVVIIGHMYTLVGQPVPSIMWNTVNSLGVAIFFSIGGYLITKSWMREPKFIKYMVKRVFRIFPMLIVCILFTIIVVGPLMTNLTMSEYFASPLTWSYLKNIALNIQYRLPGVFAENVCTGIVNGSIWCLPVEFLLYLIIPVYLSIGFLLPEKFQKIYYAVVVLAVAVAGAVWTTWYYDTHYVFYNMDFSQIMIIVPYYFMGSLVASCKLEKLLNTQTAIILVIMSGGFQFLSAPFVYAVPYFVVPYVILSLALAEKPLFSKLNNIDISYGMFLFSYVIQQCLIQIWIQRGWECNVYVLTLLSVLLSMLAGWVGEKLVEKPMGKLCRRILQSKS